MSLARVAIDQHGAVQKEPELQAFLDLLAMRDLRRVVEIGSQDCGMLFALCQVAALDAVIVSVDLAIPEQYPHARGFQHLHYVIGDSHERGTYERTREALGGEADLLFIDGDHSYTGVRKDLLLYGQLVAERGIVAFHDIAQHANPELSEVDRYWREISAEWPGEVREFVCGQAGDTWRGVVPADSCGIGVLLL